MDIYIVHNLSKKVATMDYVMHRLCLQPLETLAEASGSVEYHPRLGPTFIEPPRPETRHLDNLRFSL